MARSRPQDRSRTTVSWNPPLHHRRSDSPRACQRVRADGHGELATESVPDVATEAGRVMDRPRELSGPAGLLAVEGSDRGSVVVVRAVGELDVSTVDALRSLLWPVLQQSRAVVVVVDLRAVTFVAVAGMRVLVQARDRAAERGLALRVVVARSHSVVARMAAAGQLRGLVLVDTVDEALRAAPDAGSVVASRWSADV